MKGTSYYKKEILIALQCLLNFCETPKLYSVLLFYLSLIAIIVYKITIKAMAINSNANLILCKLKLPCINELITFLAYY